ncbi:MAG: efflux RND transporter permease subunit, partial [Pseudomonadota bacterium]
STFPALAEKPIIYKLDFKIPVVFISLYGDLDEFALKTMAQDIRDELVAVPSVNSIEILGDRDYEISVEVSEHALREYGLTMSEVSEAIKNSSVDLPGGTINTSGGDILLRTEGQVYTGQEFSELVLRTYSDGTRLLLGDIATIRDDFVEDEGYARFNGKDTALLRILASGQQNELDTSAAVAEYIEAKRERLPDGVQLEAWVERSRYLEGRLSLMTTNMLQGAILVFLILTLFLRLKVAFWVIVGIPITFFGALWLMPHVPWPATINMISLFGFILVLGIVVDDAIIIGESVYTKIRADGHTLDNVISGARKVATPATFGVLTTIAAFAPLLFIGGIGGPFFEALSVVVILCLIFSLIESKLILPAHLAHTRIKPVDEEELFNNDVRVNIFQRVPRFFQRIQRRVQRGLQYVIHKWYDPALKVAIENRGVTAVSFLALLMMTLGLTGSGLVRTVLFPDVPGDFIQLEMTMQNGTAPAVRNEALTRVEQAVLAVNDEYVAANPGVEDPVNHVAVFTEGDNEGVVFVEMPMDESRPLNGDDIVEMWREKLGEIPGVKEMNFTDGNNIGGDSDLSFNLTSSNTVVLDAASKELKKKLESYEGVTDIRDTLNSGGQEIKLNIKPEAEALGLTMSTLGRQVRQAFYGEEAQRIQRGRDELKVMVRYPREDRRSVADLENMRIRTPSGVEVPFNSVAEVSYGSAFSSIVRQNRKRVVTVMADVDPLRVEPGVVVKEVSEEFIPGLLAKYPSLGYSLEGASQEEIEFFQNLTVASIAALFLIYALIAIPLKSYTQPFMIMSVIPFGLIGAVIGHVIMGSAISMFSLFGFVALAGV